MNSTDNLSGPTWFDIATSDAHAHDGATYVLSPGDAFSRIVVFGDLDDNHVGLVNR